MLGLHSFVAMSLVRLMNLDLLENSIVSNRGLMALVTLLSFHVCRRYISVVSPWNTKKTTTNNKLTISFKNDSLKIWENAKIPKFLAKALSFWHYLHIVSHILLHWEKSSCMVYLVNFASVSMYFCKNTWILWCFLWILWKDWAICT